MSSPLQNRVTPFGEIVAVAARGGLMGNRGGRLHGADRTLGRRRWASKQWICCVLAFRGRRRAVMGESYTELFFLDEACALAAGHRPCFECRRSDAQAFAAAWAAGAELAEPPRAGAMDARLHEERLHRKRLAGDPGALPAGAMFARGGAAFLRVPEGARVWSWSGYGPATPLAAGPDPGPDPGPVEVLTPPAILAVLRSGYAPRLHPSATEG